MIDTDEFYAFIRTAGQRSIEASDHYTPTLIVERADGAVEVVLLALDGHPFEALRGVYPALADTGPIARIALTTDAYMLTTPAGSDYLPQHGELGERFAAGDPGVSECLQSVVVTWQGWDAHLLTEILTMRYHRTDVGTVGWGEESKHDKGVGGRMVLAVSAFLYRSQGA